jgi:hypothetical protein
MLHKRNFWQETKRFVKSISQLLGDLTRLLIEVLVFVLFLHSVVVISNLSIKTANPLSDHQGAPVQPPQPPPSPHAEVPEQKSRGHHPRRREKPTQPDHSVRGERKGLQFIRGRVGKITRCFLERTIASIGRVDLVWSRT